MEIENAANICKDELQIEGSRITEYKKYMNGPMDLYHIARLLLEWIRTCPEVSKKNILTGCLAKYGIIFDVEHRCIFDRVEKTQSSHDHVISERDLSQLANYLMGTEWGYILCYGLGIDAESVIEATTRASNSKVVDAIFRELCEWKNRFRTMYAHCIYRTFQLINEKKVFIP